MPQTTALNELVNALYALEEYWKRNHKYDIEFIKDILNGTLDRQNEEPGIKEWLKTIDCINQAAIDIDEDIFTSPHDFDLQKTLKEMIIQLADAFFYDIADAGKLAERRERIKFSLANLTDLSYIEKSRKKLKRIEQQLKSSEHYYKHYVDLQK